MCCGAEGFIRLYRLVDNGRKLELVHKTAVGGIPGALAVFKGRLLVGVGPIVRLYDLGKKKLLRKSEYRRWAAFSHLSRTHIHASARFACVALVPLLPDYLCSMLQEVAGACSMGHGVCVVMQAESMPFLLL